MKVFYYAPDNDRPSWGLGMIYYHVWLLNKNNIPAFIIHRKKPFRLKWLDIDVPIIYKESGRLEIGQEDFLVIPEFYTSEKWIKSMECRKIAFVQNAFYIFDGLQKGVKYEDLGFGHVFYYMPHLKKVLSQITSLPLYETPPFIAPYFFLDEKDIKRKKQIVVYPKFDTRDYNILLYLLQLRLNLSPKRGLKDMFNLGSNWKLIELKGFSHREVAEKLKEAEIFISLNTTEAFNSAVPEAMAAGCLNFCYDGIGPRDFLKDNKNAFVFENNDVFALTDKLVEIVTDYENNYDLLNNIRNNAFKIASEYKIERLESEFLNFFSPYL